MGRINNSSKPHQTPPKPPRTDKQQRADQRANRLKSEYYADVKKCQSAKSQQAAERLRNVDYHDRVQLSKEAREKTTQKGSAYEKHLARTFCW